MQGPADEASAPRTYVIDSRILGVTMHRKIGKRTMPLSAAALAALAALALEAAAAAATESPRLPPEDDDEDEDLPAAKRRRLQEPARNSTAVDEVTTDPPDDTRTYPMTPAASLPSAGAFRLRRNWTPEEDAQLTEAVKEHGTDWVTVAALVPGRKNVQCRSRWIDVVDPAHETNAGKWTPEEDAKLTAAVTKHGKAWFAEATMVPGRLNLQCRRRWINKVNRANQVEWKREEDAKLIEAVKKYGTDWFAVAALVSGRTNVQCQSRWTNTVDPDIEMKGRWKPEEDAKLMEAVEKHGKQWVVVAAMVPGRTNQMCNRRWAQTLDPSNWKIPGKWTSAEVAKLTEAIRIHGKKWVKVAAMVPGRTDKQCRNRWVDMGDMLDPANGKDRKPRRAWKPEEDAQLALAVKKYGKKWVQVAVLVPDRIESQCRLRWNKVKEEYNDGNFEALGSVV
jgi:hypothetical protein